MKKILLSVFVLAALLLCSCASYSVKEVDELPEGFILLDEAISQTDGISYTFSNGQFALLDSEGKSVFQTHIKNSSFIVEYMSKYFVNEDEYFKEYFEYLDRQ